MVWRVPMVRAKVAAAANSTSQTATGERDVPLETSDIGIPGFGFCIARSQ